MKKAIGAALIVGYLALCYIGGIVAGVVAMKKFFD